MCCTNMTSLMLFAQIQSTWKQHWRLLLDSISRCGITKWLNQGKELRAGLKITFLSQMLQITISHSNCSFLIHQDERNLKLLWVYEIQIRLFTIYESWKRTRSRLLANNWTKHICIGGGLTDRTLKMRELNSADGSETNPYLSIAESHQLLQNQTKWYKSGRADV